jgi:hypothetical protein
VLRPVTGNMVKPRGILQGGQQPSEPAQAPRQSPRTRPNNPDAIHNRGVKPCKMWQRLSVRLQRKSKQLLWTMSRDHSREVHGTNEHTTMLASRKHIKLLFREVRKCVYFAFKGGVIGAEACEQVSNVQICIWARIFCIDVQTRWCEALSLGGLQH